MRPWRGRLSEAWWSPYWLPCIWFPPPIFWRTVKRNWSLKRLIHDAHSPRVNNITCALLFVAGRTIANFNKPKGHGAHTGPGRSYRTQEQPPNFHGEVECARRTTIRSGDALRSLAERLSERYRGGG